MWVLTFFLLLQLIYNPSSNPVLNYVDTHALQALIINLNVYLLVLPTNPILTPRSPAAIALEISILVLHGTVCVHFLALLGLGLHQVPPQPPQDPRPPSGCPPPPPHAPLLPRNAAPPHQRGASPPPDTKLLRSVTAPGGGGCAVMGCLPLAHPGGTE